MNNLEFSLLVWLCSLAAGFLGALTGLGGGVVLGDGDAEACVAEFGHCSVDSNTFGLSCGNGHGGQTERTRDATAVRPDERIEPHLLGPEGRNEALAVVQLRPIRHKAVDILR